MVRLFELWGCGTIFFAMVGLFELWGCGETAMALLGSREGAKEATDAVDRKPVVSPLTDHMGRCYCRNKASTT